MRVGDLVYIPSNTYLSNTGDMNKTSFLLKTESPMALLVLEEDETNIRIIHNGQKWYVDRRDVYSVKGNQIDS